MERLVLESVHLRQDDDNSVLEGSVNGHDLYFKSPRTFELTASANPFLAAMLVPAMQRGADIAIPPQYPVSRRLLAATNEIQAILSLWYPELTRIVIHATPAEDAPKPRDPSLGACLFSGGLDACHALLQHADEISHLVYVRGIDLQLDNEAVFKTVCQSNAEIAAYMGKTLVVIESNIRFFMRDLESSPLSWYVNQAGGLQTVCLALGFSRVFVGSSNAYDALHPLGTHPLTDPLWSTETTRIVHTGCEARRHEKLEAIARHDTLLQRIRVCWHDEGFNCGVCDKCVHLRVALTILGLDVASMPRLDSYADLHGAHVNTEGEYAEWRDNLLLAEKYGDIAAARAVRKLLNGYKIRQAIKMLDEAVTGGRLRAWRLAMRH